MSFSRQPKAVLTTAPHSLYLQHRNLSRPLDTIAALFNFFFVPHVATYKWTIAMCTHIIIEYKCGHQRSRGSTKCKVAKCTERRDEKVQSLEICPQCEDKKKCKSARWCAEGCCADGCCCCIVM